MSATQHVRDQGANGHPLRIIVCSAMGDWIEWEKPGWPEAGACPFCECECTPTLYERADIGIALDEERQ